MKWGFLLSCLLLETFTGVAQEKAPLGTLSGTVQDPTGAVIAGAQVELKSGDVVVQTTVTDSAGVFKFSRVPSGTYDITVQSAGFEPTDLPLNLTSQAPAPVRVVRLQRYLTKNADTAWLSRGRREQASAIVAAIRGIDNGELD